MGINSNRLNEKVNSRKSWIDAGVYVKRRTEVEDIRSSEEAYRRRLNRIIEQRDAAIAYEDAHTVDKRTKRYKEQQAQQQEMGMGR